MDSATYKILKNVYKNESGRYDAKTPTYTFAVPTNMKSQDAEYLKAQSIEINLCHTRFNKQ